jgi:hypothetical protein
MYTFRRGPLQLQSSGDQVKLVFTGYYQLAGSQRLCTGTGSEQTALTPWSPPCTCGLKEGERKVQVGFSARFGLNSDYTVRSEIVPMNPVPLDKCTVCFWGQDITPLVMKRLKSQLDEAGRAMEDTLAARSLRPRLQQVWTALCQAYPLYQIGYLKLNPEKIRISRLFAAKDTLYLSLGISARPVVSQVRSESIQTLLPEISDFSLRRGFHIYSDAMADYDSLSLLLNTRMRKKRIDLEKLGKYMIIENFTIYGADREKLILKVDFSGSEQGTLYLSGKPVYQENSKTLNIEDLDYDINTRDVLVKTAGWLFNRKILQALQPYSSFELGNYEKQLLDLINTKLNGELYPGVTVNGRVEQISLMKIYTFKDKLVVRFRSSGELSASLIRIGG